MQRSRIEDGQFGPRGGPTEAGDTSVPAGVEFTGMGGGAGVGGGASGTCGHRILGSGGGGAQMQIITQQQQQQQKLSLPPGSNMGGSGYSGQETIQRPKFEDVTAGSKIELQIKEEGVTSVSTGVVVTKVGGGARVGGGASTASGHRILGSGGGGAQMQIITQQQQRRMQLQQQQQQLSQPSHSNLGGSVYSGQETIQRPIVENARSFVNLVKNKCGNQSHVYNEFLHIMGEYKRLSIDELDVIQRLSNLFKGHHELIVGLNTFLPADLKIDVQTNE